MAGGAAPDDGSLNPEYQTYERNAEEVNIMGRVVRAC
jgi:phage repressor protein C with HTH and peptisase S24 domain